MRAVGILILGGFVLLLLGACAPMQRNPERQACIRRCTEDRNACLLNASTAEQVKDCDAQSGQCTAPCRNLPEYVPSE
jgi:hypothetical protein